MATQFDCFSEAILGELSQIGIEIFNDEGDGDIGNILPKAIYEITKGPVNKDQEKEIHRRIGMD